MSLRHRKQSLGSLRKERRMLSDPIAFVLPLRDKVHTEFAHRPPVDDEKLLEDRKGSPRNILGSAI